jgi:hypothetical protein
MSESESESESDVKMLGNGVRDESDR